MIEKTIERALNEQIREELASAYLYLSMAAYFAAEGWDGMAGWMRVQAQEEQGTPCGSSITSWSEGDG